MHECRYLKQHSALYVIILRWSFVMDPGFEMFIIVFKLMSDISITTNIFLKAPFSYSFSGKNKSMRPGE